jgi:RNA polymerase sigma factor (sigma-70 family)
MESKTAGDLGRNVSWLFGAGTSVGLSDGELIGRVASRQIEVAEVAFETILARHGAMVLAVCRQVLGDADGAEDAFQATFLIMLRRADSLRAGEPGSLGPWLHGVAYRTALKARQATARRRAREQERERRAARSVDEEPSTTLERGELQALVHQEVNRLSAKYRAPVVLCYFEGRTHDEAAAVLQWPVGTVRGRLARARELLRARIERRGVAPSSVLGAIKFQPLGRLELPSRLLEATVTSASNAMHATSLGAFVNRMFQRLVLVRPRVSVGFLAMALTTAGLALALRGAPASQALPPSEIPPKAVSQARVSSKPVDHGDEPLPDHARLRISSTRFNHGKVINKVLYTPDGKSMVALDRTVLVWDAETGRKLRVIGGPEIVLRDIALAPDGLTLATLDNQGVLRLWELASGREIRRWHQVAGNPGHLTFSPDGRTLAAEIPTQDPATRKETHTITLWDLTSPTERRRKFAGDWRDLHALVFTPDGKTLITASNDNGSRIVGAEPERGSIRLWDVGTGEERRRISVERFDVRSIAVSPDGRVMAAGVSDRTIRIYDVTTGEERVPRLGRELALAANPQRAADGPMLGNRDPLVMTSLAFSPNGSLVASGACGTGNTGSSLLADVYIWDVARAREVRHIPAHQGWVRSLSFSPDGRTLASTGGEPVIRLWDSATGQEIVAATGHRSAIRNLVVSQADSTIFTAGQDGTIRRWDGASGRELGIIAQFTHAADTMAVAPDGDTLLVGGYNGGTFALWNITERREIRTFPRVDPRNPVRHVAFSPDGKTVASEWRIWDAATGQVVVTFRDRDDQKNQSANFFPIFYSPDGTQIITTENEGARIWDIRSGKEVRWAVRAKIHHDRVALSPDGRYLATGGLVSNMRGSEPDPQIHLWELASGQKVATLEGHKESTRGLAFSPDGRWLASCSGGYRTSNDQTVRVWDVATGREVCRFEGHLGAVNAVAFTPDGRSVVSGSDDATVLIWDVADLGNHRSGGEPMSDDALRTRWAELAGDDARVADRAGWALSVPSAVGFLREHVKPVRAAAPKGIPAANGPVAPPEVLRTMRAIAALERVGTDEARGVLDRIAQGNPDALETREAKSVVIRWNRRTSIRADSPIR